MRPKDHLNFEPRLREVIASKGQLAFPNVRELEDPAEALREISSCIKQVQPAPYELRVQNFDPPRNGVQTHEVAYFPKIFLKTGGMGGQFNGTGIILIGGWPKARAFSFQMCEHEWDESGANHSRGWHPKVCTKCGFDASIDSGD